MRVYYFLFLDVLFCLCGTDVIEEWRRKAQDRDQWRRIEQEAKAHVGL